MKQTSYILTDALARTLYNMYAREGEIVLQPVCQEYREIKKVAVALEVAQREADAQGRMILLVINGKTLATDALVALHFNRQDVKTMWDEEIDFCLVALQRPVVGQLFTLGQQRGEDEVLCHGSLEFLEKFTLCEDDFPWQSCEAAQEGYVKEIDLESCGVLIESEGHIRLLGEEDTMNHAREGEPVEGGFILAGTGAAADGAEDELLVLATQLRRDAAPYVMDARYILIVGISAEVCGVGIQYIGEDVLNDIGSQTVKIRAGSTRHTAAQLVGVVVLKQLVEYGLRQPGLFFNKGFRLSEKLQVCRPQVLSKGDGIHLHEMHLSNREAAAVALQCHAEERTCGDDMVVGGVLIEILQGIKCFGTFLDLVEKEQGASGLYGNARIESEVVEDAADVLGLFEDRRQLGLTVKVENGDMVIMLTPKLADGPAFANLTCPLQDQRLAMCALLPSEQTGNDVSLNIHNNSRFTFYRRKVWNISHFSSITGAKLYHFPRKTNLFCGKFRHKRKIPWKNPASVENSMEM